MAIHKDYQVDVRGDCLSLQWDFAAGDPPACLLAGDAHLDNPHSDNELLKHHCEEAIERQSPIILGGDLFCAMQGKWDKRSDKKALKPEHASGNYLDKLIETTAQFLKPFAANIVLIHRGNHETAIQRAHETDLTERLCNELKRMGSPVMIGGYTGFIRFSLKTHDGHGGGLDLFYHHGHGGGGPVTKGVIDFARYGLFAEADAIWTQHVHQATYAERVIAYQNKNGFVCHKSVLEIRTPSYKDEYGKGDGGFQTERGAGPRPKGGYWLSVYRLRGKPYRYQFHVERTRQ